ncbi:hypothetical protein K0M31_010325 [Melipona bicolor]|uniref:Uncharacterized protein n=1 Tax=Melipona bicolor TaxID=60889 RepID=A0AA40FLR8_9HYME|nr:hypothetical protein K0M31_010325 [Melipona bicolor]
MQKELLSFELHPLAAVSIPTESAPALPGERVRNSDGCFWRGSRRTKLSVGTWQVPAGDTTVSNCQGGETGPLSVSKGIFPSEGCISSALGGRPGSVVTRSTALKKILFQMGTRSMVAAIASECLHQADRLPWLAYRKRGGTRQTLADTWRSIAPILAIANGGEALGKGVIRNSFSARQLMIPGAPAA